MQSKYGTLAQLDSVLEFAAKRQASASLATVGETASGRPIRQLSLGNEPCTAMLVVLAGVHAREWVATGGAHCWIAELADSPPMPGVCLRVLPMLNPDGYSFSRTNNRHWRKNRGGLEGRGVDLNRNFGVANSSWGHGTNNSRSEVFQGLAPFSEPETRAAAAAVKAAVAAVGGDPAKVGVLDVHCCARVVYPPFWYSRASASLATLARVASVLDLQI